MLACRRTQQHNAVKGMRIPQAHLRRSTRRSRLFSSISGSRLSNTLQQTGTLIRPSLRNVETARGIRLAAPVLVRFASTEPNLNPQNFTEWKAEFWRQYAELKASWDDKPPPNVDGSLPSITEEMDWLDKTKEWIFGNSTVISSGIDAQQGSPTWLSWIWSSDYVTHVANAEIDPNAWGYLRALGLDNEWWSFTGHSQLVYENLHYFLQLPWPAVIILNAMLFRIGVFALNTRVSDNQAKLEELKPFIENITAKQIEAKKTGDVVSADKYKKDLDVFYEKTGVHPWKSYIQFLPIPLSFGTFQLLRQMSSMPVPELKDSSLLPWCPDLTTYDPYFVLPIFLSIHLIMMAKGLSQPGSERSLQQNPLTAVFAPYLEKIQSQKAQFYIQWGLPGLVSGASWLIPHAMFLHITVATIGAGLQRKILNSDNFRRMMKLYPLQPIGLREDGSKIHTTVKNLKLGGEAQSKVDALVAAEAEARRKKGLANMPGFVSDLVEKYRGGFQKGVQKDVETRISKKTKQEHDRYEAQVKAMEMEKVATRQQETAYRAQERAAVAELPKKRRKGGKK